MQEYSKQDEKQSILSIFDKTNDFKGKNFKLDFFQNTQKPLLLSDAIVVYWLPHLSSERRVKCSNPVPGSHYSQQKLCIVQLSNDHFERTTCWIPCGDGIKLQSLRSVRFWTSLVRKPAMIIPEQQNSIDYWRLAKLPCLEPILTLVCRVS